MKIVDVNVVIYLANEESPFHERVLKWWNAALLGEEPVGLPWVTALGFLRISTNPKFFPQSLTVEEATSRVDAWLSHPTIRVVQEKANHWGKFQELVKLAGGGQRTTDAYLAALAISHQATLVSCDTGFSNFPQLQWENPASFG